MSKEHGEFGKKSQFYIKVLEAKNMKEGGKDVDAYCTVMSGKEKLYKTAVLKKSTDPQWSEKGKIFIAEGKEEFRVVVKDKNSILPDSFLGQVTFTIDSLKDGIPHDEWYPLEGRPGKKDKIAGEIHLQVMFSDRPDGGISEEDFVHPIQVLIKKKKMDVFDAILSKGGNNFLEVQDPEENYPVHTAVILDQPQAVEKLIKKGVDVGKKNGKGQTPLHCAAEKSPDSIPILVAGKADVEAKDNYDKNTPLHIAAKVNEAKSITNLLDKGANINSTNDQGNTPLHLALDSKAFDSIKTLCHRKADYYQKNKEGKHAASVALAIGGDIKIAFMDAINVEDDREFSVVDSGYKIRHRSEGDSCFFEWQKSNQFAIKVNKPMAVKILAHFIGTGSAMDQATKVGFVIVTSPEGIHKELSYQTANAGFGSHEPTLIDLKPEEYYVICPYSQEPDTKGKFSILVFTKPEDQKDVIVKELQPWRKVKSINDKWKGETAGGANKENNPWRKNPHFILRLPKNKKAVQLYIMLEQEKSKLDIIPFQVHPYNFHIGFNIFDKEVEEVLHKTVLQNAREVYKHFTIDTTNPVNQELIIVPTTVKPGQETSFTLSVFSDEDVELEKFNPPQVVDVNS